MQHILEILTKNGALAKSEVGAVEEEVAGGERLEAALSRRGISPEDLLTLKGEYYKVPTKALGDEAVDFDILKYVPEESATHYRFVPIGIKDGVLEVGIIDPDNIESLDALNFISSKIGTPYKVFLISETDFDKVVAMYKGLTGEVSKALGELQTDLGVPEDIEAQLEGVKQQVTEEGGERIKEDAPVTKMVATIIRYAVEGRASDIHIEPTPTNVRVRFRVDGDLYTSLTLPITVHRAVVARIKILSSVKLDEKRKPQDGRFSATVDNRRIDFRVSTFPTYYGEKVVMRILDREKGTISLESVGLAPRDLVKIREALQRPYGMILISGPTGSGKSTTLYGMLGELDREKHNVLSLEDPVEYNMDGVSQSQVHPEIGYTFASGLRSILRQDPDMIMVGEIRDKETAQLAVQAALTGHLVLSTIHTNNAIGVVPRLVDMGVDPYLIAPTLILTMAQRLVRTLCPGTGKPIPIDGAVKIMLEKQFADLPSKYRSELELGKELYTVESSAECPNGTRGRTGVFELMPMDRELEETILKKPTEEEIWKIARGKGMLTMKEDGLIKCFNKQVPFEEVNALGGSLIVDDEV